MGIKDLARVIGDHAPNAIREYEIKSFFGRKIAIDASMSIYQFLIAVRQDGSQLTNDAGETTSHLMGMFYRTIRLIDNGIKPLYVFDGKPPEMKSDELVKRQERRAEAEKEHEKAVEAGDVQAIDKFSRRLVKVTKEHNDECKQLLKLMGVPYFEAPCEAEAQCAALVKSGSVYGTATEDMDGLTFGSSVLLRHMTFSEAKKMPIKEFQLDKVLAGLGFSFEEFVDLCILLGCDYCGTIRGIGPKKAFELISKHRSVENILENIDQTKYPPPENWNYKIARKLFLEPEVSTDESINWNCKPDVEGLVQFMVHGKNFGEDRIRSGAAKLTNALESKRQGRLDDFFKKAPSVVSAVKRKSTDDAKKKPAKRGKKR